MSAIGSEKKRTHKALEKKERQIFEQLQSPHASDSDIEIDESGMVSLLR